MKIANVTTKDLLHDVLNYYGVKADIFQAEEYLLNAEHPSPAGFLEWLDNKKK